jgi:hypothetical protein
VIVTCFGAGGLVGSGTLVGSGALVGGAAVGAGVGAGAQATSNWLAMTSTAIKMVRCFFIESFSFSIE